MKDVEPTAPVPTRTTTIEQMLLDQRNVRYVLRLYIAGMTPRSTLAIERIRTVCNRHLAGRFELTIVDLYLNPEEARLAQVIVVPTLIRQLPSPLRMFIGDMTGEAALLQGLNIDS